MKNAELPEEFRIAACHGKDKLTAGQARAIAKRMRDKGRIVEAYRCRLCNSYHVGRPESIKGTDRKRMKEART